ncbi:protein phosphatase 1 regulatory subunit 3A [Stigmatopora argus]
MEALSIQPLKEERVSSEEDTRTEAFYPWGPAGDDEEPAWEPPAAVRRKVSFADAFGLDLVSVKEYDEVNAAGDGVPAERDEPPAAAEEFYLSCLFAAPSSEEELERRLESQMVELEKVELLPGTSTFRGMVRVRNLCFGKSVYARITLDCWKSYFDLLADYVPGSSDRKTDGFTFQYTVVPPLDKEGSRVEFCLRYETSAGTFWANNRGMNYVMFCHQKCVAQQQVKEDNAGLKMKRSCLRASRRASTQEKEGTDTLTLVAGASACYIDIAFVQVHP